tara:strand:- start:419 stop:1009 length:591 start_codon:yes stop_codon:yes gene_type:complete
MRFPIFPLNGAILFPGTNLPLNIFEKRYIEMVDYALSNNRLIGMIQKKENDDFFKIGCLGKITSFSETGDGRYQINLEGLNRFLLKKIVKSENNFIIIDGEILKSNESIKEKNSLNEKLLFSFKKFLKIKNINFNSSEFENLDASSLAKIICIIAPLDHLIKQMLLEFDSDYELCKNLLSVLEIEMKNNEDNLKIN